MKERKKALIPAILLIFSLLLTGCDIEFSSGFDGILGGTAKTEQEEVIPTGSYPTIRSSTIKIDDNFSVTLPGTYHYATHEVEEHDSGGNLTGTHTVWYGYEKDVNYINPNDEDIMFYAFKGNDLTTPDATLTVSQANASMTAYIKYFVAEAEKRTNPIIAANGSIRDLNQEDFSDFDYWVFPFYLYDNRNGINSTYNTVLYPKYYYGVCVLDREADKKPSRNWYIFIFSNDATGNLIDEESYTRIYEQDIKHQFGLDDFPFPTQFLDEDVEKRIQAGIQDTNPLYVAEHGYNYEQFCTLFAGTTHYYEVLPNIKIENPTPPPEGEEATEAPAVMERRYTGLYAVLNVVDGDTFDVDVDGVQKRIRLIGIDTPESVNPDESLNTPEGVEASTHTKELLAQYGNFVYLEWGEGSSTDSYGRTLAYVYVTDGKVITMLNRMLIEQGYARVMTVEPDTRYTVDFEREQKRAQKAGAGFWGTGFFVEETEDNN